MFKTRSDIYYDITKSTHTVTIEYDSQYVIFYFSSKLYKTKFLEKQNAYRTEIQESLKKRFGIDINVDLLADLKLYSKIEKRGYFIETAGGKTSWQNSIKLDGLTMTMKD